MIRLKEDEKREYSMKEREGIAKDVMSIVAQYYGMSRKEMITKRRFRKYSQARYISMYMTNMYLSHIPITIQELGQLHKLSHSEVVRARKEMMDKRRYDPNLRWDMDRIERLIDKYIKE